MSGDVARRWLVGAMAACAVGCGGSETEGGDTPKAVFEMAKAAAQERELARFIRCFSPRARAQAVAYVLAGGAKAASDEALSGGLEAAKKWEHARTVKALKAIYRRHGFAGDLFEELPAYLADAGAAERALAGVDVVAMLVDLYGWFHERLGEKGRLRLELIFDPFGDVGIGPITVTGDSAIAKSGPATVTFRKRDGRWYLHDRTAAVEQVPGGRPRNKR